MTTPSTLTVQDLLDKLADIRKDAILNTYHQGNLYNVAQIECVNFGGFIELNLIFNED